jgi:hypothetical protein
MDDDDKYTKLSIKRNDLIHKFSLCFAFYCANKFLRFRLGHVKQMFIRTD